MIAIGIPGLARGGLIVVSVALLAIVGLAGAPAADHAGFPAVIQMFGDTPSGVAVDKPGNVYVSVREPDTRNVIWKYTPDGDLYVAMMAAAPGSEIPC